VSGSADAEDGVVMAIDFGGTKVALATATTDGRLLKRSVIPTDARSGAEPALARALEAARALVAESGAPLAAVGAVSPGIVLDDRVLLAPNVPGWESIPLARRVRDGLADGVTPLPPERVVTGTDAKAAALAEMRHGALRDSRLGVFLNLGTGLSVAITAGGRVLTGAHEAAGEIAYQLTQPGQPGCATGAAPLEATVSGRALGERASAASGVRLTGVEALHDDDPRVVEVVEDALGHLEMALTNMCCLLDPDRIVVGGGLLRAADVLLPRLRAALERGVPFPPALTTAHFPQDAPLFGALTLALDSLGTTDWVLS
jgi:glucokinase